MAPPLRPASAMNDYSRSSSRASQRYPGEDGLSAPPVSVRKSSSRSSLISVSSTRSSQLSTVTDASSRTAKSSGQGTKHEQRESTAGTSSRPLPLRSTKSVDKLSSKKPRPSLAKSVTEDENPPPLTVKKARKPSSNISSTLTSPSSTVSKSSSGASVNSEQTGPDLDIENRRVSKSSSALRETIAKAKAARKAAKQNNTGFGIPDTWDAIDVQDPFNQLPKEPNLNLLRKRIQAARTSGSLNIAAMGLKTFPEEVLTMYDYDPDSNADWYESVDLVKMIVADNELETIPDEVFPDVDPNDFDLAEDTKGCQFAGTEVLDLHGNLLRSLPIGLRRLQRLSSLNLSNNQFTMESLQVISELESLTDLKLANNQLEGQFLPSLCHLPKLEALDLRGNRLTLLPDAVRNLARLRILNISDNELTRLPFPALSTLPLIELNAVRNKLQGTLIAADVTRLESLQTLNVANNSLERLSERDELELPNLQTLSVEANWLRSLPNVSSWRSVLRISAAENSIEALPEGFTQLDNLKHVDLTGNNITMLDERIGLMDNLTSFRIANNPLRERKFLTMDTEDLKQDLRNRCAPEPSSDDEPFPGTSTTTEQPAEQTAEQTADHTNEDDDEEGSEGTEFTLAPESPSHLNRWKVKTGGILDRSETEMTELEADELKPLLSSHDIKQLYINRNKLQNFPVPALHLISHTLTDLDISNNPLKTATAFSEPVSLPHLQNLTMTSTGLTSLEPLLTNLDAPSLKFLDVSNNRLTGAMPKVRQKYPNLATFLAADNKFTSVEFEAVIGLQVLDISNNDIDHLPPKLGLLGPEPGSTTVAGGIPGLKRLEVSGNSFRVPRWQVVVKGTEAILEWLKGRIPAEEIEAWENNHGTE